MIRLLLPLLLACCFTLATLLDPRMLALHAKTSTSNSVMAALDEGRQFTS